MSDLAAPPVSLVSVGDSLQPIAKLPASGAASYSNYNTCTHQYLLGYQTHCTLSIVEGALPHQPLGLPPSHMNFTLHKNWLTQIRKRGMTLNSHILFIDLFKFTQDNRFSMYRTSNNNVLPTYMCTRRCTFTMCSNMHAHTLHLVALH